MEFKIVQRYYPVTLTKRSQLCKTKHKDKWQHKDKTDKFFNVVFGF